MRTLRSVGAINNDTSLLTDTAELIDLDEMHTSPEANSIANYELRFGGVEGPLELEPELSEEVSSLSTNTVENGRLEDAKEGISDGLSRLLRLSQAIRKAQTQKLEADEADRFDPGVIAGEAAVKDFRNQIREFLDQISGPI
jgi:hypothetical protein